MQYKPIVSIIIPVYNGSNYMREAIDSAISQTYRPLEILVINDGSTDNGSTHDIAKSYGDKIRYFQKENGGVSSALNVGINNMKGEWFSWLSHDDIYYPEKIERQIVEIDYLIKIGQISNPTNVVLYSSGELMDKTGKTFYRSDMKKAFCKNNEEWILKNVKRNYLGGCSFLVPKAAFEKVGTFAENIRTMSDYDMWYRLALGGFEMHYIPEILVRGRVHNQQVTYTYSGNNEYEEFHIKLINELSSNPKYNKLSVMLKLGYYTCRRKLKNASHLAFEKARAIKPCLMTELIFMIIKLASVIYYYPRKLAKLIFFKIRLLS